MEPEELFRIDRGPSTPERVAARIRELISSGALPPGEFLPPQIQLASSLGVSRSSLREALTSLEAGGFIQKMHNGRYRITALAEGRMLPPLHDVLRSEPSLVWDLIETASVMVVEAVRLAASRIQPQQVRRLEECMEQLERAGRNRRYFVREFNRIYMNFYETVALATGNVVYNQLGHAFMEMLAQALPHTDRLFLVQEDINAELYRQHLDIFRGIASRDPASAARAFRRHLSYIEEKLRLILGEEEGRGTAGRPSAGKQEEGRRGKAAASAGRRGGGRGIGKGPARAAAAAAKGGTAG